MKTIMKKSVGSFVALNRKAFLLLGFMLSVGVFGVIAWSINAQKQGDDSEELLRLQTAASELKETYGTNMSGETRARYESIWDEILNIQNNRLMLGPLSPATSTIVPGTLTAADPTFNRPLTCGSLSGVGTAAHYDVVPITLSCSSTITVSFEAADGGSITPNGTDGAGPDTFMVLYGPGGFNAASPLTNCLNVNDDILAAANRRSRIISATLPAGSYTAVLTSFNNVPTTTTGDNALPWTYSVAINDTCVAAPPSATDFGTLTDLQATYTTPDYTSSVNAGIKWYKFTLPAAVNNGAGTFLDMDVEGTAAIDTEICLFDAVGAFLATDDDDGSGQLSQLSYGLTAPTRTIGTSVGGNGRDGSLAAGTYFLAVGPFDVTCSSGFNAATTGGTATIVTNLRTNVTAAAPTNLVVTGTNGDDTLVVTATGPNSGSYVLNGGAAVPFSGITSFTFNGLAGNDTFTVNNPAGGLFAPSGGIFYDGGGQTGTPGDKMSIVGGTETTVV